MTFELSKREKVLIFAALIIVLLVVSSQFIIVPIYKNYVDKLEEYELLSSEKAELDLKFQNEPLTRMNYENVEKIFDEIEERYPRVMLNEEIDRVLTRICLENNLSPIMLGISEQATFDGTEKMSKDNNAEEQESSWSPAFIVVTANMNLSGDYNSLQGLLDTVEELSYIRISRVSFSNNRNENSSTSSNISISFEITMLRDTL